MRGRTLFALLVAGLPALCAAQAPDGPDNFGTQDEAITVIGYKAFYPLWDIYGYRSSLTGRWSTEPLQGRVEGVSFETSLSAPLDMLPHGSLLTQVTAYVFDNDNGVNQDVHVQVCRQWVDSATGDNPNGDCPISMTTSGAPGDTYLQDNTGLPILYRQDIDGDGSSEVVHYSINALTFPANGIRMVRLRWLRRVSPAPVIATFNDVATNDWAFQFIEAFAASGITLGCIQNPPQFCPDGTVTRREMAVFFARALGLHWPWNAQ